MIEASRVAPTAAGTFPPERLARIRRMEDWHFWFRSREERFFSLWDRWRAGPAAAVLDLGCGTGRLSRALRLRGEKVVSFDRHFEPAAFIRAAGDLGAVQADATQMPFAGGVFSAVVALDILEHVDDGTALRETARVLARGGLLFLTVPALQALWSHRDDAAGHKRRYDRRGLVRRIQTAGLDVLYVGYFHFFLLPAVWLSRLAGRATSRADDLEERPFPILNAALLALNRIENALARFIAWPIGSSLILVASKR